jgi:glycosyltransferase involved in cell wall biosynthesis
MMRILHVVQGYSPAVGGTEKTIQAISEKLVQKHGDQVTVYTTVGYNCEIFWRRDQPSLPVGTSTINGVTVRRFPVFNRLGWLRRLLAGATYKLRLPFNDYFRILYNGPIIPTLTHEVASAGAEIVAASSFPLLHMQYATNGARRAHVPVVLIGGIHAADAWGFDNSLIYRTLRRADHTIAYTEFEQGVLISRGVPAAQITVIGLGVEPSAFARADGTTIRHQHGWGNDAVVGYIGQQVAHKGIDTLIASMMRVWQEFPDTWLLVAGSRTSFTAALEAQVEQLPPAWQQRVTFLHNFDESIKADLFSACDVFAHPSAYESFGLTLLEAWAAGRPVIACRDGAAGSIVVDGQDGLLIDYRDAADLAQALRTLLAAPEQRRIMGRAGLQKVLANHTWDIVTERFRSVYARVREQYAAKQNVTNG